MPISDYPTRSGGPVVRPYALALPRQPRPFGGHVHLTRRGTPNWWASRDQRERRAAIWICRSCPVLAACREWSLSLPSTDTSTIYAAMTASERIAAASGTGSQRLRLPRPGCGGRRRPMPARRIVARGTSWPGTI